MSVDKWEIEVDEDNYDLSEESAARCVKELLSFYKIRVSQIDDEAQRKVLVQSLETLQVAYREGRLENKRNDDGGIVVTQTMRDGGTFTYREIEGKDKRVMDNYEQFAFVQKQQALLGKLCGLGADAIGALKREDLRTAEALSAVFFNAS